MSFINVSNLSYQYENNCSKAIDNISFQMNEGEIIAFLGSNGSGKSTLARNLNCLLYPTEGTIIIDGINSKDNNYIFQIRKTLGMVFQNPDNQIVGSTVIEDLAFGPENIAMPIDEMSTSIEKSIKEVDIDNIRNKDTHNLSGGQKQRVAIAGILAMKPKCIILDEATAMLDPRGRMEVMDTILRLNKELGISIILITHYMDEAAFANTIYLLKNGQIINKGDPRYIFSDVNGLNKLKLDVPHICQIKNKLIELGFPISKEIIFFDELNDELINLYKKGYTCNYTKSNLSHDKNFLKSEILIKIKDLCFSYDTNIKTLQNINLDILKGGFYAILGHTGSGKSTLIQQIIGLEKPDSGEVYFRNDNIFEKNYSLKELRCKIGLVFQYPEHQLFEATVLDDVCFGPLNQGLSKNEAKKRAMEALSLVNIDESYYNRTPFNLSGGQMRRVAIAGIIAMKPEVLILDEPAAGLDPYNKKNILDLIKTLNEKEGITIILVSHSMEDVAEYAENLIILNNGELIMSGDKYNIFSDYKGLEKISLRSPISTYLCYSLSEHIPNISIEVTINDTISTITKAFARNEGKC